MAAEFYSVLMLESMYLFLFGWGAKCWKDSLWSG